MNLKSVEKPEVNKAVLEIEVTAEEFANSVEMTYRKIRGEITVPGFRKGKAPRKVIEATYGPSVFYEEAVNSGFPKAYAEAIVEANLNPIEHPQVELVTVPSLEEGYVFKATVILYPEIKLGEYKGISAPRKVTEVTEADIDKQIDNLRQRNARVETADKAVENGDVAVIDFEGYVDGVGFEGGKAEKYSLEVGSGSFIPGFEDQIVGMKADEDRDITVTFPEGYSEELGGKEAVFKIKLHEVKQKILPELDDEFVKDVSEFDTMQELRDNARKKMTETAEAAANTDFLNSLLAKIVESSEVELPASLVDSEIDMLVRDQEMMLKQQGMTMEQYASMTGQTTEQIRESARPTAETMLKIEIALNSIAEYEHIEVSDEELEQEYQKMADMYKVDLATVKKSLQEADLRASVLRRKAEEFICDNAVAEEPVEEPAEAEKPKAEKKPAAKKPAAKKPAAKKTAAKAEESKSEEKAEEKAE